ncbi:MAG: TolC family protein, partial [Beggiatoa sp.]|nr:TolC family protein [Beggiatoa sp.]
WADQALVQNLRVAAATAAVDTAREEIDRRAAGHFPTLDLVGRHGFNTNFGNVGVGTISSPFSDETDETSIGLELAVPIFSGGAVVSQTREAAERHQQAIEQREQARRESYRRTRVAFLGVVAGISRIKALKQAVHSSEVSVASTKAGLEVGTRTAVDVVVTEQALFRTRRDYARARYNYLLDTLRLKFAAGTLTNSKASSSISRFLVLAFARLTNYAILLVSPIVFVRILDQHAYGQYREFVVYALALATVLGFSVKTSILYFIPKDPDNERKYVTQTALFIFASSVLGLGILYAIRHIVFSKASFDFAEPLLLYVFFFLNLDFVESYWLAKKRSDYVLYYSTAKIAIKITLSMAVAYMTRSVEAIVTALVCFEACKFLILLSWFSSRRLFTVTLDVALVREHLRLVLPFGAGTVVYDLNHQLGKLVTSMTLGPSALAVYTIGAYQVPVIGVVRSAAGDVLFPDMVQRGQASPMAG